MDTTDLVLAIFHHLLVFSLAGIIGAEFVLIRGDLGTATLKRLAGIDRHYGIIATLIIVVGIGRVFYGLKGWEFYVHNWVFWAKIAAFVVVGLLVDHPDRPLHILEQAGERQCLVPGAGGRACVREDLHPRRSFHLPAHPGLRRRDGAWLRLLGWRPSAVCRLSPVAIC